MKLRGTLTIELNVEGNFVQGTQETRTDPAEPDTVADIVATYNGKEILLTQADIAEAISVLLDEHETQKSWGDPREED